jgi:hypothetical protein
MEQTSITKRRAWSVGELSKSHGLSDGFLRKKIREGALRARKLGRRVIVLDDDWRAFLNK